MYIVFEGIIGTGKTTQSKKLLTYIEDTYPNTKVVWTREPGGTEISDAIRKVVQATVFEEKMQPICEAYLFAASRAQSLRSVVKPSLDKGYTVISDRNFITSLTNQAFGRNLGLDTVLKINLPAIGEIIPDLVIFMDLPIEIGLKRTFDQKGDKFESLGKDFYERVYEGHKQVEQLDIFKNKWVNIDANGTIEEVFERVIKAVKPILDKSLK